MKLTDEMLYEAAPEAEQMVMGDLPPEDECGAELLENFELRTHKTWKHLGKRFLRGRSGKAVVVAVVCVILCGIGMSPVPAALHERILQFTSVYFTGTGDAEGGKGELSFGYLPEGMEMSKQEEQNGECTLYYFYDGEGHSMQLMQITLDEDGYSVGVQYDGVYEKIEWEGVKYIVYSDQGTADVIWESGGYVFHLSGNMDQEELINIARNSSVEAEQGNNKK